MEARATHRTLFDYRTLGLLTLVLTCWFLLPGISYGRPHPNVKLIAKLDPKAPTRLQVGTRASRKSKRVAYFVDGRRQAVDRSYEWRLGRRGSLGAGNERLGRHRLTTKVFFKHGGKTSVSRTVYLAETVGAQSGSRWRLAPPNPQSPPNEPGPDLVADFERGLWNWNTAGVGDTVPTVVSDTVREGSRSAKVTLNGSQGRSELILGGDGSSSTTGMVEFREGDEFTYRFSFYIVKMIWGRPGAHNLIFQLHSNDTGSPPFGLALWDYAGNKGLWTHGTALTAPGYPKESGLGGDTFRLALNEKQWYDVKLQVTNSKTGEGSYELYVDGDLIARESGLNTIRTDRDYNYIKNGLYRNGGEIPGTSELRFDNARLSTSVAG